MKNEFGYEGSVGKEDYIAIMHVAKEIIFRCSHHQNFMQMATFSRMLMPMRNPTQLTAVLAMFLSFFQT